MPADHCFVVITTIHQPTLAVAAFCRLCPNRVVVVGDRKTPGGWSAPGADYLSPEHHRTHPSALAAALPWDHYARKMLGYLRAIELGADVIYDTDDDNAPEEWWDVPPFDGEYEMTGSNRGFVNAYSAFTEQVIWPRGLPLNRVRDPAAVIDRGNLTRTAARVGIWQALANGEPDVDAIYRLVDGRPSAFQQSTPIVLGTGTVCPFNSQATAVRRALFPLLYLPSTVNARCTDIFRGLVAQPIMWAARYMLGFTGPTVVQDRNPHDILHDFALEVPVYVAAEKVYDTAATAVRPTASVAENLTAAYEALVSARLVGTEEVGRLATWLSDLDAASRGRA